MMNKVLFSASGVLLALASSVGLTQALNQTVFVEEAAVAALPYMREVFEICYNQEFVDDIGICKALGQFGGSRRSFRPPRGSKKSARQPRRSKKCKKYGKYSKSSKSTQCPNQEKFKVFVATTFAEQDIFIDDPLHSDIFVDKPPHADGFIKEPLHSDCRTRLGGNSACLSINSTAYRGSKGNGKEIYAINATMSETWVDETFWVNPPGTTSAIAGFVGGIVVTFDKEVDPLSDFSGNGFEDFLNRLEDAAQYVEVMVGVITGTCTSLPSLFLQNEYCNYGLDWISFPLTKDKAIACDPLVKVSQLRAAGTLIGGGDVGFTPITGTGFDLAGAIGGNVLFLGNRYNGSATLLGYVPFTKTAACNANEQVEAVTLLFSENYDFEPAPAPTVDDSIPPTDAPIPY